MNGFRINIFALFLSTILNCIPSLLAAEGDRWAVVIGINEYQDLGKLTTARNDAKALAEVLVGNAGYQEKRLVLMTDDGDARNLPTLGNIQKRLEYVCSAAETPDTVLVFFSGHGITRDGEGYLVPVDGDAKRAIPLRWVKDKLEKSKASSKILILDACHSGSAAKGVGGIAPSLVDGSSNLVMLLSSSADQVSYPDESSGHSVFSRYLIEAFSGEADSDDDNALSQKELFDFVNDKMKDWCVTNAKAQSPLSFGGGDFVLAKLVKKEVFVSAFRGKKLPVPEGFRAKQGTTIEPYTNTGYAKEVIHEKTGIEMVFIPAGEFMMGSPSSEKDRDSDEGPVHRVRITKPFYMGKYEVTVGQFKKFVNATGYRTEAEKGDGAYVYDGSSWVKKSDANWKNPYFTQGDANPVVCVSWNDVKAYCDWSGLNLPTEAEWEYACRAGGTTAYCFGDSKSELGSYAWYNKNSADKTHEVGQKRPNAWGLYDIHGNVWEWCSDWYRSRSYSSGTEVDPTGPSSGFYRVVRGGSWSYYGRDCRSANRYGYGADSRYFNFGFRVVVSVRRGL